MDSGAAHSTATGRWFNLCGSQHSHRPVARVVDLWPLCLVMLVLGVASATCHGDFNLGVRFALNHLLGFIGKRHRVLLLCGLLFSDRSVASAQGIHLSLRGDL